VTSLKFLDLTNVVKIHRDQISLYGGQLGVRDFGLLQSALAMPRESFGDEWLHRDIFEMAAAYAFHISQNHPFIDGNKRTGLASALVFLDINGFAVQRPDKYLYDAMISISTSQLGKLGFADVLRSLVKD
jgi:death-on-curing protein